ncbi:hypothetical protein S83_008052 [Arachis hypogaea]
MESPWKIVKSCNRAIVPSPPRQRKGNPEEEDLRTYGILCNLIRFNMALNVDNGEKNTGVETDRGCASKKIAKNTAGNRSDKA